MPRLRKKLLWRAFFQHFTAVHKHHTITDFAGKTHSCVTTTIVVPWARWTITSVLADLRVKAEVGSSNSITLGSMLSARAITLLLPAREFARCFDACSGMPTCAGNTWLSSVRFGPARLAWCQRHIVEHGQRNKLKD
jgi:hypothetical protein